MFWDRKFEWGRKVENALNLFGYLNQIGGCHYHFYINNKFIIFMLLGNGLDHPRTPELVRAACVHCHQTKCSLLMALFFSSSLSLLSPIYLKTKNVELN